VKRALVIAVLLAACGKKPEAAPTPDAAPAARSIPQRQPRVVRKLAPISAPEVGASFPSLAGARVVKPVGMAQIGQVVEASWCFEKGDPAVIAAEVEKQVAAAGWSEVSVTSHPAQPDRLIIKGQKPPYALFGNTMRGKWAECDGDKGQTFVKLGVHHVESVGSSQPGAVPGRKDLRTPLR
jgi:hypothetical protein